ncbi:MAG TPA: ferritin-like domain-containing protein [Chthoniobacterales bacterium]|nr:ferritin-like domain-containing protein [Chthoniobacterales bacterium]
MKSEIKLIAANERDSAESSNLSREFPQPRRLARRSFLRNLGVGAALLAPGAALLGSAGKALAGNENQRENDRLTRGDVAILQLLAAAELIEADLWQQYNELGGINAPTSGYTAALQILDGDQLQYISDNTDDEMSHAAFLNAYLRSKGEQQVDLRQFARLQPSQVSFVPQTGRLTNLKQLTVDTSWWTRYRSTTNPDFGATFPDAVPSLNSGLHTAIPRNDAELGDPNNPDNHIKAIAFTAGFHFGYIEQGGTSLYATLAQKVTSLEVLRILISIGGSEIMHFQTWQDKAGNATPLTYFDPINHSTVTFTDLTTGQPETLQANLIMPEPCEFISPHLPACAIIRPTGPGQLDAVGAINSFIADGLFRGQSTHFLQLIDSLARAADAADREID